MESLPYNKLVFILKKCKLVLTDSGGIQEEAPAFAKPVAEPDSTRGESTRVLNRSGVPLSEGAAGGRCSSSRSQQIQRYSNPGLCYDGRVS